MRIHLKSPFHSLFKYLSVYTIVPPKKSTSFEFLKIELEF